MQSPGAPDIGWIASGIDEWEPGRDWTIGHMIPAGYPAYLRILHPATLETGDDQQDISWRETAAISGRTLTALSNFEDLLPPHDIGVGVPYDNHVGERLCTRMAEVLAANTATPQACTFLFGMYWGAMFPEGETMPAVELAGTRYSAAAGHCRDACGYSVYPATWWPADRSWIVVTPSDGHSTLIGCNEKTAQELLADPAIEAWPISRSDSPAGRL